LLSFFSFTAIRRSSTQLKISLNPDLLSIQAFLKIGDLWDHFLQPRSDLILDLKKGHLKDQIISFLDHFWKSKIFLLLACLLHFCLFCGSKLGKKQKLLHFSVMVCALVDFVVTMNLNCSFLDYGAVLVFLVKYSIIVAKYLQILFFLKKSCFANYIKRSDLILDHFTAMWSWYDLRSIFEQ
jgi:hypothetical protein